MAHLEPKGVPERAAASQQPRLQHSPSLPNMCHPQRDGQRSIRKSQLGDKARSQRADSPRIPPFDFPSSSPVAQEKISASPVNVHLHRARITSEHNHHLLTPPLTPSSSLKSDSTDAESSIPHNTHTDVEQQEHVSLQLDGSRDLRGSRFLQIGNIPATLQREAITDFFSSLVSNSVTGDQIRLPASSSEHTFRSSSAESARLNNQQIQAVHFHPQHTGTVIFSFYDIRAASRMKWLIDKKSGRNTSSPKEGEKALPNGSDQLDLSRLTCVFMDPSDFDKIIGRLNSSSPLHLAIGFLISVDDSASTPRVEDAGRQVKKSAGSLADSLRDKMASYGDLSTFRSISGQPCNQLFLVEYYDIRAAQEVLQQRNDIVVDNVKVNVSMKDPSWGFQVADGPSGSEVFISERKSSCEIGNVHPSEPRTPTAAHHPAFPSLVISAEPESNSGIPPLITDNPVRQDEKLVAADMTGTSPALSRHNSTSSESSVFTPSDSTPATVYTSPPFSPIEVKNTSGLGSIPGEFIGHRGFNHCGFDGAVLSGSHDTGGYQPLPNMYSDGRPARSEGEMMGMRSTERCFSSNLIPQTYSNSVDYLYHPEVRQQPPMEIGPRTMSWYYPNHPQSPAPYPLPSPSPIPPPMPIYCDEHGNVWGWQVGFPAASGDPWSAYQLQRPPHPARAQYQPSGEYGYPLRAQRHPAHPSYTPIPTSAVGYPPPSPRLNRQYYPPRNAGSALHGVCERNQLDIKRIENGSDTRTTVMVKNIPNKMSDKELIAYINKVCPRRIDFLYLRMDFQNGCNVGYAFVNFISVQDLLLFAKTRLNEKWNVYSSEKVLQMSYATYQGKEALVEKFKNSCIMDEREEWRPKIFYSEPGPNQGLPQPFPSPTHMRRKERSSHNRGALFVPGVNAAAGHSRSYLHASPSHRRDSITRSQVFGDDSHEDGSYGAELNGLGEDCGAV